MRFSCVTTFGLGLALVLHVSQVFSLHIKSEDVEFPNLNPKICLTPECTQAAASILSNMDDQVNPCQDFYSFTCGSFVKETVVPDDKRAVSQFSLVSDRRSVQLLSALEEISQHRQKGFHEKVQNLYESCMDLERLEQIGLSELKSYINEIGGWSVLNRKKSIKSPSLEEILFRMHDLGFSINILWKLYIDIDDKNSSRLILQIDQPSMGLPRKYFEKGFKDRFVKGYESFMIATATVFGSDPHIAKQDMKELLKFEALLSNLTVPDEERRNVSKLYNKVTIRSLIQDVPNIPWLNIINKYLSGVHTVTADEEIIIWSTEYLKGLSKMIDDVDPKLPIAAGSIYVRNFFKSSAKEDVENLANSIMGEFKTVLGDISWLDQKTRERALEKIACMRSHVGYPSELLNDTAMNEFYEELDLDSKKYFDNTLRINVQERSRLLNKFREKVDKENWLDFTSAAVVNAFYNPPRNRIELPAAILQEPYFNLNGPKYLNYASIGSVIGHEITHGFDDQGRQYDQMGDLHNWWEPSTEKEFLKRAKGIIEQYGNYEIPEYNLTINGINTQGENIADNGGIKLSYRAYQNWVKMNGEEELLPGLMNFTPNQLFWISLGNVWCSKYKQEAMIYQVRVGVHSPPKFRVNAPLENMPEFSKDFNCPEECPMNPSLKYSVW